MRLRGITTVSPLVSVIVPAENRSVSSTRVIQVIPAATRYPVWPAGPDPPTLGVTIGLGTGGNGNATGGNEFTTVSKNTVFGGPNVP